jgi:hypothetical protein
MGVLEGASRGERVPVDEEVENIPDHGERAARHAHGDRVVGA